MADHRRGCQLNAHLQLSTALVTNSYVTADIRGVWTIRTNVMEWRTARTVAMKKAVVSRLLECRTCMMMWCPFGIRPFSIVGVGQLTRIYTSHRLRSKGITDLYHARSLGYAPTGTASKMAYLQLLCPTWQIIDRAFAPIPPPPPPPPPQPSYAYAPCETHRHHISM